jgi:hypothetical protein
MTDNFTPKNAELFNCINCDFVCSKKSDWNRHILTRKHKNTDIILTNTDIWGAKNAKAQVLFFCDCGKDYKHRQSLFNHKKKCSNKNSQNLNFNEKELIITLLNQNNQLQHQIMELCKDKKNITNINSDVNINSNNKTFNLNVFLNEHCKDAMNIMDFVDSVKLQLSDLENVGKLGFVEGISNIIVKNLQALDIHKRPVHCSDSKREVMYIKDEDKWEKENEEKNKLRKVIKHIAHKNSKLIPEFRAKYPDCNKSESKKSDQYNKLVIEAMGGSGDNDNEKENKIIKRIAKEVIIDKKTEGVE